MTIWRMLVACWVPKATNTHFEYSVVIVFPWRLWLYERSSFLRFMYIAFLDFAWWQTKIRIENWNIQDVFQNCLNKLTAWVPHTKKKLRSMYIPKHFVFEGEPSISHNRSALDFYLWRLSIPKCLHLQLNMKRHFTNSLLIHVKHS
jgi:hypothetical protein